MVQAREISAASVSAAVDSAAREFASVRRFGTSSFLNLPLIYPDGSNVTVRVDEIPNGVRVSDGGFAYREIDAVGAGRSFGRVARKIVQDEDVLANRRMIYVDVSADELFRAICDVATASWRVVDQVYQRVSEAEELEIAESLRVRLSSVFGSEHLKPEGQKIQGSSSTEWEVSAIVAVENSTAVFHAVSNHPNSIFKTSTAFHDLACLENPPRLVSVVRKRSAFGHSLALLSQAGRVIESDAADDVLVRSAA